MTVQLADGVATEVYAGGRLEDVRHEHWRCDELVGGQSRNRCIEDDQLSAITLERDADVTYRHITNDQVSRFRGDEMVLRFDTGVYNRFAWKVAPCRVTPGDLWRHCHK